jgi:RecB family endonuclease NucS
MRIVVAECSVTYSGRGDTTLARAARAIIIKADGAISIHSDKGNKPLNYMGAGNVHSITDGDEETLWAFDTKKETLQIHLHHIVSDQDFTLEQEEPGLVRDGTEPHLQAWLAEHPHILGEGYTTVQREYQTGAGPVDLLMLDENGNAKAVEIKRVGLSAVVYQTLRYVDAMNESGSFPMQVTGVIAALDIRPNTVKLAERRGVRCVTIPSYWRDKLEE